MSVGLVLAFSACARAQTFGVLHTFPSGLPPGGFDRLLCAGNALYGLGPNGTIFRINASGTGYTTLKTFPPVASNGSGTPTNSDGATPLGGVILAGDTLFGTASMGGLYGFGTIFSLMTNGSNFTVIKQFSGTPDGKDPYAELLLVSNVLYGTTAAGGTFGKGTIFQVNPDGSGFNLLHHFDGTNGLLPLGGLTFSDGVLYGTTLSGGTWTNGTVFSMNLDGSGFTNLKSFTGLDGANPRFNLVVAGNWIYGTAEAGGSNGGGVVFSLSTDGAQYNILKTFSQPDPVTGTNDDGYYVQSGLAVCGGALFGSTREGGFYGSGVLFSVRMDGSGYTVLRHFTALTGEAPSVNSDGAEPGPLSLAGGTLYGTPDKGGSAGEGTLFALNIAPQIQFAGGGTGIGPLGFAFNILGYSNQVVVVQAGTAPVPPDWQPLGTNTIGAGPAQFLDPAATNYPERFYRLQAQ